MRNWHVGGDFLDLPSRTGDNGMMLTSTGQGEEEMCQTGFFDLQDCYGQLDKLGDALSEIDALVPWEEFRPGLRTAWRKEGGACAAGCKPHDEVLMLKVLLLSELYGLSSLPVPFLVLFVVPFSFQVLMVEDSPPDTPATTFTWSWSATTAKRPTRCGWPATT